MYVFNQEQEFVRDFPLLSKLQIMEKYQLTESQYERIRKKNNLIKPSHKMSDDEIEFIKQNYKTMSDTEIGKALGRHTGSITQRLRKMNLSRKIGYAKGVGCEVDREYSVCIWWLTGDSIEEIKLLYNNVRGVNVNKALKNKDKMAKAIREIQNQGCFPIVRTAREIFNMSGLDVKL